MMLHNYPTIFMNCTAMYLILSTIINFQQILKYKVHLGYNFNIMFHNFKCMFKANLFFLANATSITPAKVRLIMQFHLQLVVWCYREIYIKCSCVSLSKPWQKNLNNPVAYSKPCQTSKISVFQKQSMAKKHAKHSIFPV